MSEAPHSKVGGRGSLGRRLRGRLFAALGIGGRATSAAPELARATKHLWSIGIYRGGSPMLLAPHAGIANPVVTRELVTDRRAGFVADPFLVRHAGTWHLFFESFDLVSWRGEIGLATSEDLHVWSYERIVLSEPFHLSYPFVFAWDGAFYMVPECHETTSIRLYRADEFPFRWRYDRTLVSGRKFGDATVFRHADRWWLFAESSENRRHDELRLYSADALDAPWVEHPASPLHTGDATASRPAGRVVHDGAGLIRLAQDCIPRYGMAVNAYRIKELTVGSYREDAYGGNPILHGSGAGWNGAGMHHIDAHLVAPGEWIAAVDGWHGVPMAVIRREG